MRRVYLLPSCRMSEGGMRIFADIPVLPVTCPCCGSAIAGVSRHVRGRPWTEEQDNFILRASTRGATNKLIAYVFGTSQHIINNRLIELRRRG